MCVEQVISYALGEEVNDETSCVGEQVRSFVTCLNDQEWSSNSARAEGMRELSIAQLGSKSLNQNEFRDKLLFSVITKMLPAMFRDLEEDKWEKEIKSLEGTKDLKEAREAAYVVRDAIYATADPAASYATLYAIFSIHAVHAAYVAIYAFDATKTGDKYLCMIAHLAVQVLKEMKSPGCQFL